MFAVNFNQVGNNIAKAMERRGINQQQLANQLGISKQVMSKIINGKKAINVAELSQIAAILGSSADDLLSIENNDEEQKPSLFCMGKIRDERTREKIELLLDAVNQIHLLEDLINE